MMNFRDILWERNVDMNEKEGKKKAEKIFDSQVAAIREIAQSEGFLAIMEFFEHQQSVALEAIASSEKPRLLEKATYKVVKELKMFIESRLGAS